MKISCCSHVPLTLDVEVEVEVEVVEFVVVLSDARIKVSEYLKNMTAPHWETALVEVEVDVDVEDGL
jgi:hypothetical protein